MSEHRAKRKRRRPPPPSGRFDAYDENDDLVSPVGDDPPTAAAAVPPPSKQTIPRSKPKTPSKSKDPFADDPFAGADVPEPTESEVKAALPDVDPFASDHGSKSPVEEAKKAKPARPKDEATPKKGEAKPKKGEAKPKKSSAKPKRSKDPFADDPFAAGDVPEPSESEVKAALPDIDPFASDHGSKSPVKKAKAKPAKLEKGKQAKPEKAKQAKPKDPFADDPFADADVPEPSDSAVRKALAEAKVEDPFASQKQSAAPPVEPEDAKLKADAKPKAEKPKAAKPKDAEPKAEEPKAAEPKAAEPKAAEPKAAEPKAAEPKAAAPKAERAKAEAAKAEAAKAERPKDEAKPKDAKPKRPSQRLAPAPAIAGESEDDFVAPTGRASKPKPKPREASSKPAKGEAPKSKPKPKAEEPKAPKIVLPAPRALDQCAVCREQTEEEEVCPTCGLAIHPACLKQVKRCPSAECAGSKSFHEQLTLVMRKPRTLLITGVCASLIAVVALGGLFLLNRHRDQQEADAFLAAAPGLPARQAVFRGEKLRPSVQAREEVAAMLAELREKVEGEEAQKKALAALADGSNANPAGLKRAIKAALRADPTCALAYVRRAGMKWRQALAEWAPDRKLVLSELVKPALVDLNEAIRHEPEGAPAYYHRALTYMLLGKQRAAQNDLERALRFETDTGSVLRAMALGRQAELAGDMLEALTQFERAETSDPRHGEARVARGWALFRLGKAKRALKVARQAQALDRNEVSSYLLELEACHALQEGSRGYLLRQLDRTLTLFPACARALALRAAYRLQRDEGGRIRSGKADRQLSERDAKRALLQEPQVLALGVLAELAAFRGKAEEAEKLATKALAHGAPRDQVAARVLRARLRLTRFQMGAAVKADLDAALEVDPDHVSALVLRGHAHLLARRLEQARADLSRAIFLQPGLVEAHRLRGRALLESDPPRVAPAILDFDEAIQGYGRRPGIGKLHRLRGRAYFLAQRYRKALSDLRMAKQLGEEVPPALLLRVKADAAYRKRRWRSASQSYQALLKLQGLSRAERKVVGTLLRQSQEAASGKVRTF